MRFMILALAIVLVVNSAGARKIRDPSESRHRNTSRTCEYIYWSCRARHPGQEPGCKSLWAAARLSHGVWGEPEARVAAQIQGRQVFCEN